MLLNAVILILQETLEAALLISVLAAVCYMHRMKFTWLLTGMITGSVFASIYAMNLQAVSEWFGYVGQEVVNAILQGTITVLIGMFIWLLPRQHSRYANAATPAPVIGSVFVMCVAATIVMLAITREGSEIALYLSGIIQHEEHLQAVLMGSGLGFGIGLSIGFLLFYGLLGLSPEWGWRVTGFLLALLAGNMLAQAVLQLTQADWIPATQAIWDSSAWLPEHTVLGRLLYALLGYEATPSFWYVLAYLVGCVAIIVLLFWCRPAPSSGQVPARVS